MTAVTHTIVVTGGAGFVGSNLIKALVEYPGVRIISLDNYFGGSRHAHVEGVTYREGHTKDIAKHIPETTDLIFHLGEYSRVEQSLEEPDVVWDLNVRGTFGVLEFCRAKRCKLVYAGSSTKFGDGGMGRDQSPYAWTKATNTELVCNYGDWYELDYAITYFYNVYGPGERTVDQYGTVVATFADRFAKGLPLRVTSPGTQRRNFTHVDDIVRGLILIGEHGQGDEYGLGAPESYSILELAHMFTRHVEIMPERAGNRMSGKLDTRRTTNELGWQAEKKLRDYVEELKRSSLPGKLRL